MMVRSVTADPGIPREAVWQLYVGEVGGMKPGVHVCNRACLCLGSLIAKARIISPLITIRNIHTHSFTPSLIHLSTESAEHSGYQQGILSPTDLTLNFCLLMNF